MPFLLYTGGFCEAWNSGLVLVTDQPFWLYQRGCDSCLSTDTGTLYKASVPVFNLDWLEIEAGPDLRVPAFEALLPADFAAVGGKKRSLDLVPAFIVLAC